MYIMKKLEYVAPSVKVFKMVSHTNIMNGSNPNEGDGNIINVHGTSDGDIENDDFILP
jgi:hypothetical protein